MYSALLYFVFEYDTVIYVNVWVYSILVWQRYEQYLIETEFQNKIACFLYIY